MKENKAELKQKLRIKEGFILRNSIKVGSIEEHNNKLWHDAETEWMPFLYNEFNITWEFYIESAYRVARREVNDPSNKNKHRPLFTRALGQSYSALAIRLKKTFRIEKKLLKHIRR